MSEPKVLWDAEFNAKIKPYYLWSSILIFTLTIVLIPVAIVYAILGNWFIQKYLDNLQCTLTERTLELKKGILNKRESTVPLEKITDLQMFQGPIMRYFGLHGFKVETAGQSMGAAGGSLLNIVGIIDTPGFRKAVLAQRDRLHDREGKGLVTTEPATPAVGSSTDDRLFDVALEIRDSLKRIEAALESRDG
ncbi:MAG: PH domain-containing protein [Phycisphaerales bacterium]|nr:PH domain-containing protein [Phycisphaerales bacterium]